MTMQNELDHRLSRLVPWLLVVIIAVAQPVYLKLYMGSVSVVPTRQRAGISQQLSAAREDLQEIKLRLQALDTSIREHVELKD